MVGHAGLDARRGRRLQGRGWARGTHFGWREDLRRVSATETRLDDGLDHLKQCGHLAYWLRRMGPVYEFNDLLADGLVELDTQHGDDIAAFRGFLVRYASEFIAFDLAFQICWFYEMRRTDRHASGSQPRFSENYLTDVCHMMKFKHVSPHALFLVFKSLAIAPCR